jgi:hypothetical protein
MISCTFRPSLYDFFIPRGKFCQVNWYYAFIIVEHAHVILLLWRNEL